MAANGNFSDFQLQAPEEVWIKADHIRPSGIPSEWIVTISTLRGKVTLIATTSQVNQEPKALRGSIIAKQGSDLIADLPNTPISGSSKVRLQSQHLIQK